MHRPWCSLARPFSRPRRGATARALLPFLLPLLLAWPRVGQCPLPPLPLPLSLPRKVGAEAGVGRLDAAPCRCGGNTGEARRLGGSIARICGARNAPWAGSTPLESRTSSLAPQRRRRWAMAAQPAASAKWSGVRPLASAASTGAPPSRRTVHMRRRPSAAAWWRAVRPFPSRRSTGRPESRARYIFSTSLWRR